MGGAAARHDRRRVARRRRTECRSGTEDALPLLTPHLSDELFPEPPVALPAMPLSEHVVEDYVATGLSLKEHPVRFFRDRLTALGAMRNTKLRGDDLRQDAWVTVAGLVLVRQRPGTAKGVIFMTLEDETDIANIIVWPKAFAKNRRTVMTARFLAVRGRLQRAGLVIHVVAENFVDLSAEHVTVGCATAAICFHPNFPAGRCRRRKTIHSPQNPSARIRWTRSFCSRAGIFTSRPYQHSFPAPARAARKTTADPPGGRLRARALRRATDAPHPPSRSARRRQAPPARRQADGAD